MGYTKPIKSTPWRYISDLKSLDSLFRDENILYDVAVYQCSCEESEPHAIMYHQNDESNYQCVHCNNEFFYDANIMCGETSWYSPVQTLFTDEILLGLVPTIIYDDLTQVTTFQMNIDIPCAYDFIRNKFHYQTKTLYEAIIAPKEPLAEKVYANFDLDKLYDPYDFLLYGKELPAQEVLISQCELLVEYKQSILRHLKRDIHFAKHLAIQQCNNISQAALFIAFANLSEFEFVYWAQPHILSLEKQWTIMGALDFVANHRREKSFKKAIYLHYKSSMLKEDKYDFRFVNAIAQRVQDVNIAIRMIKTSQTYNFHGVDYAVLNSYMTFLVNRFTPKQVEKLFRDYARNDPYWINDTLNLFEGIRDVIDDLEKIPSSFTDIHDTFMRVLRTDGLKNTLSKITFTYGEKMIKACGKFDGFDILLPQDGLELYAWGDILHNCLSTYYNRILNKTSTIFGFYEDGELKAAVEIENNTIMQANSKYNQKLEKRDEDRIIGWHRRYFSDKGSVSMPL